MSDIPESVMIEARKQCDLCGVTPTSDMRVHAEHVAALSILAERESCAKIAEEYGFRVVDFGPAQEGKAISGVCTFNNRTGNEKLIADAIRRR